MACVGSRPLTHDQRIRPRLRPLEDPLGFQDEPSMKARSFPGGHASGSQASTMLRCTFCGMRAGSSLLQLGDRLWLLQAGFTSRQLERMSWARMRRLVAEAESGMTAR